MKSLSLPRRLLFFALALCLLLAAGCVKKQETPADVPVVGDLKYESTVPLEYADQFAIYCYEGGYRFIDMKNSVGGIFSAGREANAANLISAHAAIASTPMVPIRLSCMISRIRSRGRELRKPSAVSASPSR